MRLKPDGSLDLDWREPAPTPMKPLAEIREELIVELMQDHPQLSRAQAEREIDNFY